MTAAKRARLALVALGLITITFVLLLAVRPASSRGANGKLIASAVPANPGPVTVCPAGTDPCPLDSFEQIPLYVTNTYPLVIWAEGPPADARARWHVPNAFDVTSVDETITVDGAPFTSDTFTPPPNGSCCPNPSAWDGHWPSTAKCPSGPTSCYVTGSPAVLPGETTAPLYASWIHAEGDPAGKYVFTFTIHGTVNDNPVDVTASTPKIIMN